MIKVRTGLLLLLALLFSGSHALAAGYIGIRPVPAPEDWPGHWYYYVPPHPRPIMPPRWPRLVRQLLPLTVKEHIVTVSIRSQVARTTVEQVFHNPNGRQLEGQFIFPFEDGTAVEGFSLWMNGKETKGELLEAAKARKIYEDIVRRMRDPGLLEYVGRRMFKCRVFPIPANGDCRIKLTYSRELKAEGGLVEYSYPLRSRQPAHAKSKMSFSCLIEEKREILNIYSPTHAVDVGRPVDGKIKVSFETGKVKADRDLKLFYNVSTKDVGLSFLGYRPKGEDGTFMAILTPRDTVKEEDIIGKDILFVLDTSGSMRENGKIDQARKALKFCLASLRAKDNFGLITFSTEATLYSEKLIKAGEKNVAKVLKYVDDRVKAIGGTAIDEALRCALKMNPGKDRPFMVVFMTDGQPTIGERSPVSIIKNVKKGVAANVRLFSFGVGYDVNSSLLDDLASENRGTCTFVSPKENIEVKLGAFYTKISSPVLTDVKLSFGGLDVYDVYPRKTGDLFRDQQLVITGRYRGKGAQTLVLTGKLGKRSRKIVYEFNVPVKATRNDFLPRLWAMRRVAHLLEKMRRNGDSDEVRKEIIRLSKMHGIMTPYTSWLVIEDQAGGGSVPTEVIRRGFKRRAPGGGDVPLIPTPMEKEGKAGGREAMPSAAVSRANIKMKSASDSLSSAGAGGLNFGNKKSYKAESARRGRLLGDSSTAAEQGALEAILQTKDQNSHLLILKDDKGRSLQKNVAGKTFYLDGERWVDGALTGKEKEVVKVKYMSEDYFKLLRKHPALAAWFSQADLIMVKFDGKTYEVVK
jgi:Ca-activated chloride channel homolog